MAGWLRSAVVSALTFYLCFIQTVSSQSCDRVCRVAAEVNGWASELGLTQQAARQVVLSWNRDSVLNTSSYVVQFREQLSTQSFNTSQPTGQLSLTLDNLKPNTEYEAQVCRANFTDAEDDCGNCIFCLSTTIAEEPPSPPVNLKVRPNGPAILQVTWEEPIETNGGVRNYSLFCVDAMTGNQASPSANMTGITCPPCIRAVLDLSPSTSYNCSVLAINEHGESLRAFAVGTTPPRVVEAGVLLVGYADRVVFVQLTESRVELTQLLENDSPLFEHPGTTLQGIDYHFYRDELYLAFQNGSLIRRQLQPGMTNNDITLSLSAEVVSVYTAAAGALLGSVTVDWVEDELYWVETETQPNRSRIMRGLLSPSGLQEEVYCVAAFPSTVVPHIIVDATRGYFYWNVVSEGLYRTDLPSVRTTTPISACLADIQDKVLIVSNSQLDIFTLEPNEALYFIGDFTCTQTHSLLRTNLNADGTQHLRSFNVSVNTLSSYTNVAMFPLASDGFVVIRNVPIECSGGNNFVFSSTNEEVFLTRTYRSVQQPLPVPPSFPDNVLVQASATGATITWDRPEFLADFFSTSAFSQWDYRVLYTALDVGGGPTSPTLQANTTALSLSLSALQPSTLYQFNITASGPGGEVSNPSTFTFSTQAENSSLDRLLVATEAGVIRTSLLGQGPEYIDLVQSAEANGVTFDSYDDVFYWAIAGGQSNLFTLPSSAEQDATVLFSPLRNPSALKLDWVGRRLFWVETGALSSRIRSATLEDVTAPLGDFALVDNIQETTAMDALNGLLFWTADAMIFMKTLSDIELPVCLTLQSQPSALAVDVSRQLLYWLSAGSGETVVVSQINYSIDGCDNSSIVQVTLSAITLSPSVLAYASNTLFIASLRSNKVYSIPSALGVLSGTVPAVGVLSFEALTPTPQSIRDIAIASQREQPLPGDLSPSERGLAALVPAPPGSPRLQPGTTPPTTVVVWDASPPLPSGPSPFFYRLDYSLQLLNGTVQEGLSINSTTTSATLSLPPFTRLTGTVTTFSLWQNSAPSPPGVLTTPPARPQQVQNVRGFLYQPRRGSADLSALIVWDPLTGVEAGGFVENYVISVFDVSQSTPEQLQDIYEPPTNETTYSVQTRSNLNAVSYILQLGTSYEVEVNGSNPTGDGPPSQRVPIAASYPQQVLRSGPSSAGLAGEGAGSGAGLAGVSSPLAVDSLAREVYWFDEDTAAILRASLDGGETEVFISTPQGTDTLALSFDWVGRTLYYVLREVDTLRLLVMSVPAPNKNGVLTVFPRLTDTLPATQGLRVVVDPFRGFLYWLASGSSPAPSPAPLLMQLDLRDPNATSSEPVTPPLTRRRRGRRSTTTIALSSLSLSPALALDPQTGSLYISDNTTGDILTCDPTTGQCCVVVERSIVDMQDTLPASSLAVDAERVYWTSSSRSGVFAVAFADNRTVIVVSSEVTTDVATLNPQQNPLPSQACLSPLQTTTEVFTFGLRPMPRPVSVTNTSITITWTTPTLAESCRNEVFSFPPLSYDVVVMVSMATIEGYPQTTFDTVFTVEGLTPYTDHEIHLLTSNEFTLSLFPGDDFAGDPDDIFTAQGVPAPAVVQDVIMYGTSRASVTWQPPGTSNPLNGDLSNLTYFVRVNGESFQPLGEMVNLTNLIPGVPNNVELVISNRDFNSSATVVPVVPWAFPPVPTLTNSTNMSLTFQVELSSVQHFPLEEIALERCLVDANDMCNCTLMGEPTTNFRSVDPLINETVPFVPFTDLESFTRYCVMTIGRYREVPGFTEEPEVASSIMATFRTDVGVPDAPVLRLEVANLSWFPPNERGSPITSYRIIAVRTNAPTVVEPEEMNLFRDVRELDLNSWQALEINEPYTISGHAVNSIGESASSDEVGPFNRRISTEFGIGAIVGVVIGCVVLVAIAVCVIFLCVWCFSQRPTKRELQLSYMYGPDHELSNLRDAYRHQHANNPHYTWSRDDYVCSDDDLEQLSKFPRQHLKLEDFIDRGEFGEVYQGTATDILGPETGQTPVAVKTLRKGSTIEEQRKFLSEAALMGNFNHPNIVKVLGVCIDNDPVYIIMELMPAGDLLKFLRDAKRDHGPALLTLQEQIQVALDVAQGCRYLEQQHFIHRDIAARNCLVSSKGADRVVKIGDFGLAKDLYSSDYYQVEGQRKLPVRWMSPEALLQGKFTIESDIWSYGVLIWEIMSLGNQPYPGRTNQEVLQYVTGGGRLDRPEKCPGRIYHLMQNCWKRYGSDRQHFPAIITTLTNFMEALNRRPDSVYYGNDSDSEDGGEGLQRQSSGKPPARTPSFKSGILNLARSGSMKLRNSLRRHGSVHKRDDHAVSQFSDASGADFRERGPF